MCSLLLRQFVLPLALILFGVSTVSAQVTLVATGSVWKYLDDGSDQGTAWRAPLFDDSSWTNGPAPLGYGDGDEATVVRGGPSTNRFITTYFRNAFEVPDVAPYTNLLVRLLRDDGGVVYLNGVEIFRSNLTNDSITFQTLAAVNVPAADESTNFHARAASASLLVNGVNMLAVEIHQVTNTSTDISFDLELLGNAPPTPPTVAITSPVDGAALVTANVPMIATAADADGVVTRVEFYVNGAKVGEDGTAPYSLMWSNVPLGNYTLTAVARDDSGLRTTSAPVNITVSLTLIPGGSNWKYLDDGSDQGVAWRALSFDDNGWSNGVAQLGYGDGGEGTLVNGGPSANRFITTYFRRAFDVTDPARFSNLVVRVLRDDGAVVYLNGVEVFRSNMPNGPVDFTTLAANVVPNGVEESTFYATHVPLGLLAAGPNLMAVEIHQVNNTSSDISFDLQFIPNVPPTPPVVAIDSPADNTVLLTPASPTINVSATDFDNPLVRVDFYDGSQKIGLDTTEAYSLVASNLAIGVHLLRAVATDASGLSTTSAPVSVTVFGAPVLTTLVATGSVWKYLDTGVDQGTAWRNPSFDDSGWAAGPAELGFGDNPLTTINIGPAGARFITTYFRHQFNATNAASFTNLAWSVLRDDGVVVYLNGVEVFRSNMPLGPVGFLTNAITAIGGTNENYYVPTNTSAAQLLEGTNLLAVELHQSGPGTSDASFDLGIVGIAAPVLNPPPLAIALSGAEIVISWTGSGFILQAAPAVSGLWSDVIPATSPYTIPTPTGSKFYRLRSP